MYGVNTGFCGSQCTIVPTKSDSHVIFCLQLLSIKYNATHKILTCVLHVRRYCSVVVMSHRWTQAYQDRTYLEVVFFSSYFY